MMTLATDLKQKDPGKGITQEQEKEQGQEQEWLREIRDIS